MKNHLLTGLISALFLLGCGGNEQKDDQTNPDLEKFAVDSNKTAAIQVGGVIFCIPSPFQTAFLIKDVGVNYNKEFLNTPDKINSYSTEYYKALNLGIYGADLGYTTIYDQPQDGIQYLNSVQSLAGDLGVSDAFSKETLERITKNIGNKDSLMGLVSICYRSADEYLKNNDAANVASLIITGGWIESMFFVTEIVKQKKYEKIVDRIGGQKQTLDNIIKLLQPYYNQPEFTELIDKLVDLYSAFDGVETKYAFSESTHYPERKSSKINSKTAVNITDQQISQISEKIQSIRNLIVG